MSADSGYDIFALGLDGANLAAMRQAPWAGQFRFHPLLSVEELLEADELPIQRLLDRAQAQLESFEGEVDAIVGYWDFPVSSMVPILCERLGLPTAGLRAVLKCEHKYWSRLEQRAVLRECPAFELVRPEDELPPCTVGYPMWVKPVKSFSSELAFRVSSDQQFLAALRETRSRIGRVGQPFQWVLDQVDLPAEIEVAGGQACLAEEAVSGAQLTVEGYHDGEGARICGIIDSHMFEGTSSFLRYQYPSTLPGHVQERASEASRQIISHIGLAPSAFNIEYLWDDRSDTIRLLEINPRQSQSHAKLFESVDGAVNHDRMIWLALGQQPSSPCRAGEHPMAATWFLRRFTDGLVRRVPSHEEVSAIESENPGTSIQVLVSEGSQLSDLPEQDSYSYALATVHTAGSSERELADKYESCVRRLGFEFDDAEEATR